jgi:hypothetical protein
VTDGQSASLSWYQAPLWNSWPDIFSVLTVAGFLMWGALSDERTGLNLLYNCFWALPEQPLSGSEFHRTQIIFCCLIWNSPNREDQVPVFISPRNRVAQLYPRALGSLSVASYDSQGLRWRYSNPPPHGEEWDLSTISYIVIQFLPHRNHIVILTRLHTGKS